MAARDDRRLVKLVRDDVEKFCGGDMAVRYEPMSHAEFVAEARKKLVEEVAEYLLNPCIEELGDVEDIVELLRRHDLGASRTALTVARMTKRKRKGGFDGRLGMYLHVAEEHRT